MKKCKICGGPSVLEVCSAACCLEIWKVTKPKSKRNAKIVAMQYAMRSIGEVKFAADLEDKKIPYDYEPDKFKYIPTVRTYCPDFRVKKRKRGGGFMYLEYKGNLRGTDRTKMRLFKKQYPDVDLRFIFEKPGNKLNKQSKTTYSDWASQYGFPWAECVMPPEWGCE